MMQLSPNPIYKQRLNKNSIPVRGWSGVGQGERFFCLFAILKEIKYLSNFGQGGQGGQGEIPPITYACAHVYYFCFLIFLLFKKPLTTLTKPLKTHLFTLTIHPDQG